MKPFDYGVDEVSKLRFEFLTCDALASLVKKLDAGVARLVGAPVQVHSPVGRSYSQTRQNESFAGEREVVSGLEFRPLGAPRILDLVPEVPPVRNQPFGDAEQRYNDLVGIDPVPAVQHGCNSCPPPPPPLRPKGWPSWIGPGYRAKVPHRPSRIESGRSFQPSYRLRRFQGISMVLPGAGRPLACLEDDVALAMPHVPRKTAVPRTDVPGSHRIAEPSFHEISAAGEFPRAHGGTVSATTWSSGEAHDILVIGTTDVTAGLGHRCQIDAGGRRLNPARPRVAALERRSPRHDQEELYWGMHGAACPWPPV